MENIPSCSMCVLDPLSTSYRHITVAIAMHDVWFVLPLQVLFIPDRWWHATLNVDSCVFVSTFLGPA